jgi:KDO2-lipid IV(A) lauroyltransferase
LYRLIGYRVKVVRENLVRSFPEKSDSERRQIERDFYKHLGDLFVETIKGMSISESEMKRRMLNLDQHHYDELYNKEQSAIIVMSHCGNWEWICLMSQIACQQRVQCIYKSLSNSGFDRWMFAIRSKFGANPIPMEQTLRVLDANKAVVTVNAFIGDQNPSSGKGSYWTNFLNQDTPFMMGPEKIAKKFNMPLYYLASRKVGRGFYEATTVPLCLDPSSMTEGEITRLIAEHTEREILQQPHIWLWSHRRWKHKRNA